MRRTLTIFAAGLLAAGTAWAVKPGGKLYIKTRDTKVLQKAELKAKEVGLLQPGDEVTWEGADKKDKQFHKVKTAKLEGFTLQQNLTPNAPQAEALSRDDGKPIDAQAFASSGAATKAMSEAAMKYAAKKQTPEQLTKGIFTAEGVADAVSKDLAKGGGK